MILERWKPRTGAHVAGSWLVIAAALGLSLWLLATFAPLGVDWQHTYSIVQLRDPFVDSSFTNPPWVLAFLPHAALDVHWSNAINLLLNVGGLAALLWRLGGGRAAWALVFTSPVFVDLLRTNNVEWLVCLGLLLPAQWGAVLLAVKPQVAAGALLVWARRHGVLVFVPVGLIGLASLLAWGWWPGRAGLLPHASGWNLAPWPVGVLPGLWLLWRGWKDDDVELAAVATPLLTPYIAGYSLVVPLAVAAARWPRAAAVVWFGLWWFVVVELRRG